MPGIVPHRHCVVCGKAIEADEVYCSDECKEVMEKEKKRQRNFMIFMFAILLGLLVLMFLRA